VLECTVIYGGIQSVFETLYHLRVYKSRIEGLDNLKLSALAMKEAEDVKKRKDKDPSATGYEDSPLDSNAPVVKQLRETIKRTIHEHIEPRAQEGEIWAHVLRYGETTQIHSHRNKKDWDHLGLSWVYYPQMPEGKNIGGKIVFQFQVGAITTISKDFTPRTGDFLIFPSWLNHFTTRCTSPEARISISGNYRFNDEKLYDQVSRDPNSGIKKLTGF
jgi:hypothetical protein